MLEQKPSHEVERIVHRAPRQDCVEAQIWGRAPNISAALKTFMNTESSTILKWKNVEQSGEKGLGEGGDQEPDGHSDRAPEFLCGDGRTFQKDNHVHRNSGE